MSEPKRRFFTGDTLQQALVQAANYFNLSPEEISYRSIEKRHGFLRTRRRVVIEVDPEAPRRPEGAAPVVLPSRPTRAPVAAQVIERSGGPAAGAAAAAAASEPVPAPRASGPREEGGPEGEERGPAPEPRREAAGGPARREERRDRGERGERGDRGARGRGRGRGSDRREERGPRPAGPRRDPREPREDRPERRQPAGEEQTAGPERGAGAAPAGRPPELDEDFVPDLDLDDSLITLPEKPRSASERYPVAVGAVAEAAQKGLDLLLGVASLRLTSRIFQGDGRLEIDLAGEDADYCFDEEGEMLRAIEHLLPRLIRSLAGEAIPCRVDCESFHEIREEQLRSLAQRIAAEVRRRGRARTLEPMNPADRRIVHMTLADDPGVETESDGEGYYKRITVRPV